jgi:hypothetical protein
MTHGYIVDPSLQILITRRFWIVRTSRHWLVAVGLADLAGLCMGNAAADRYLQLAYRAYAIEFALVWTPQITGPLERLLHILSTASCLAVSAKTPIKPVIILQTPRSDPEFLQTT